MTETNALAAVAQAAAQAAFAANNSAQLNTIVVATFGFLGVVVTTFGTVLLARINANAREAKAIITVAKEQSVANGKQLDQIHDTTRRTYAVVNKPFGVALETAAKAMEYVANLPGSSAENRQAAATARKVSDEHHAAMLEYELNERVHAALVASSPSLLNAH